MVRKIYEVCNFIQLLLLLLLIFSTFQIDTILKRELGKNFIGVYPLERLPDYLQNGSYVINTHTSNLNGEHWIAIFIKKDIIRVFDPMGLFYPPLLVQKLEKMYQCIEYNHDKYQNPLTFTCGQYCIEWLKSQYKQ